MGLGLERNYRRNTTIPLSLYFPKHETEEQTDQMRELFQR